MARSPATKAELLESVTRETGKRKRLERLLAETREQQAAAGQILRVIATSRADLRPVFDAIVQSALRLCAGSYSAVYRVEGEMVHLVAHNHQSPQSLHDLEQAWPMSVQSPASLVCRSIRERAVVHVSDTERDATVPESARTRSRAIGQRSILAVPMLREGVPIGAIRVSRGPAKAFSPNQIALLETFADQAVIAIENVRLFTELHARNGELTEALEQQTATSEVLKVISRSAFDLETVLETLLENAAQLCGAEAGLIYRLDDETFRPVAHYATSPEIRDAVGRMPIPAGRGSATGRAAVERRTVHIPDVLEDPEYERTERQQHVGNRTILAVPMLREEALVGVFALWKTRVEPFTGKQIELVTTFADQAVIAIENVRLFTELAEKNRALTTALEQQVATGEILRVISECRIDVQPVFDAIAESSLRLLRGWSVVVTRLDGDALDPVSIRGGMPNSAEPTRETLMQLPRMRGTYVWDAIFDREVKQIEDVETDELAARIREVARRRGWRANLAVPMLRNGEPIGIITVSRVEPGRFSAQEVELLKTFADQAVIAVENVRLFKELEARNRDLTESLAQQMATSQILSVISSSPTDAEPVFKTILAATNRLCEASFSVLWLWDGEALTPAAHENLSPALAEHLRTARVLPDRAGSPVRLTVLERTIVHVPDILADSRFVPAEVPSYRLGGARSILSVPMFREGNLIGVINTWRREPRAFTDAQIDLLRTFADQAVIAIENARLFRELDARNRDLTQSLAQQTATSQILRVISQSQTDVQPVFDVIVQRAVQLCGARFGRVYRYADGVIHLVASHGLTAQGLGEVQRVFPRPASDDTIAGRVILTRRPVFIPDIDREEGVPPLSRGMIEALETHSQVTVPILRAGEQSIGAITVGWAEPDAFDEQQIALLKTFADQAVIAIENVRLFNELQERTHELSRSVEQLTALAEVGRAVSSTLDLETVLTTIVSRAVQLSGLDGGVVFEYDERAEEFVERAATDTEGPLAEARRTARIPKGEGAVGRAAITREPVQVADITAPGAYESRLREHAIQSGIRAILVVPMVGNGRLIGCLGVTRNRPHEFPAETIELLRTFATQSALAIQNARLYRELEQKSRELEAASRHKSEFLANMSHELRTPLNAIIGFSEALNERMFGALNEKQEEYLRDIHDSGQHLLSLINDILDLSKIEAGRMELELSDFSLAAAVDSVLTLVRERAGRRGIALHATVDEGLDRIRADERKVRQVLLNLLSNAIKFTPEGGRIEVRAAVVGDSVQVCVTDTGVGIAPEDQEAVFEEFRQVGTAAKKVEGTGLGLALSRKFVELHGGSIWVNSQVGVGSAFTFTIPSADRGCEALRKSA